MFEAIKRALAPRHIPPVGRGAGLHGEDDELTEGMTALSQQIMDASMDVAPFVDVDQPGGQVNFGLEYGDMAMSTSGRVHRRENLPDTEALIEEYPSFQPDYLHFGHEGHGHDAFGIGVIIPSYKPKVVASSDGTLPLPPPAPSSDGDGGSSPGAEANDYGAGNQGESPDNALSVSSGGIDPFALAAFGEEEEEDPPGAIDLLAENDGEDMSFQPVGDDAWDVPEQKPTLRNPVTYFAGEFYPNLSGPAPILGAEFRGPMSLVGCDTDDMGQGDLLR